MPMIRFLLTMTFSTLALTATILALLLGGCAHTPVQQSVVLPMAQGQAFQHAAVTLAQMGAANIQSNAQTGVLTSTVGGAATLNVTVVSEGEHSRVNVVEAPLPGKIAFGSFTEAEKYIHLLTTARP